MPTALKKKAIEKSSYTITVSLKDSNGTALTPSSATWTLTDGFGNVINSRSTVSISSPSSSMDVTLSGDDLALSGSESGEALRVFTLEAIYNSLPLRDEATFSVVDLVAVS